MFLGSLSRKIVSKSLKSSQKEFSLYHEKDITKTTFLYSGVLALESASAVVAWLTQRSPELTITSSISDPVPF